MTTIDGYRSQRSMTIAVNRQTRAFNDLLARIRSLKPAQKRILGLMLGNERAEYDTQELAVRLDYTADWIQRSMKLLVKVGVVMQIDTYTYLLSITPLLRRQYPDLDTDDLLEQFEKAVA